MVYSTCTFNPIEDEAVVSEVLRICGGAVELVDVSGHLPALKRLPGKHHWRVRDKFRCVGVRAWLGDGCLLCCCFSGTLAVASWVARPVLPLFSYPQHVQDEYHCLICVRSELTAAADTAHVVEHWILLPSFHPPQLPLAPFLTAPPPRRWYDSWEQARSTGFKLDPSMFPTPEKAALPLERCMRFLPHHQDTGGFFVCVLRKVRPLGPMPCMLQLSGMSCAAWCAGLFLQTRP